MSNKYFKEIKKNFGFGFMRLPMLGEEVDVEQTIQMVDAFMEAGFNYFDTAHGYISEKSEIALRESLVKRYPRESYVLTDKLSPSYFDSKEDIYSYFNTMLEACGVEYFDFFLMHCQNAELFEKYKRCEAYETAFEFKKQGKVKHVGFSFHDKAEVLDQILTEYPEIEVVQIQFNYLDFEDPIVEGRKCYEVCVKHNKPVIVMEPVRGGRLVNLPAEAQKIIDELQKDDKEKHENSVSSNNVVNAGSSEGHRSNASYAIRFAASFPQVMMVLSGMSDMDQMNDNISYMKDFKPLSEEEHAALKKVCDILVAQNLIPCTACRYCVDGCPKHISIPDLFRDYNDKTGRSKADVDSDANYKLHTEGRGKASDCVECGRCEKECPQHLEIRKLLKKTARAFEG